MKTEGYWVYEITTPNGMVYVGMSSYKYTCQRWQPSLYKRKSLYPYIEEFGWDVLKKEVIKDGLTKEEAFQFEDSLIRKYKGEGRCINDRCSGGLCCDGDKKEYNKQYRDEHKEEIIRKHRQYNDEHKEKLKQYRDEHKEQMREYNRKYYARQKELKKRASLNYDTLW